VLNFRAEKVISVSYCKIGKVEVLSETVEKP